MLHKVNVRMGMEKTRIKNTTLDDGQTCVTLDVGSVFSTYKKEVKKATDDQVKPKNDVTEILLKQESIYTPDSQKSVLKNDVYQEGDMLLV